MGAQAVNALLLLDRWPAYFSELEFVNLLTFTNSGSVLSFHYFCLLIDIDGRWVTKLIARLLATAALWVRIYTFLKNTKVGDISKGRGQHTPAHQKI
jgi:hypothetical protein